MEHSCFLTKTMRWGKTQGVGIRIRPGVITMGILGIVLVGVFGCSSPPETVIKDKTQQEIKGDSDQFFQKMEQEERKQE